MRVYIYSHLLFIKEGGDFLNINKILEKIENNQYNIQDVFNCCIISIYELKNTNKICNIKKFITCLIQNLDNNKQLLSKYKLYTTIFDWKFTAEQIIIYSILVFYDLKSINIIEKRFLRQFKKELKLYSTFNAYERLEYLLNSKNINL